MRAPTGTAGSVTAETAVVLPSLVLLLAVLAWTLAVVGAQLRCAEATRSGARALARGEPPELVRSRVAAGAGLRDARVSVRRDGPVVVVHLSGRAVPPWPLLGRLLGGVPITAESRAVVEPGEPGSPERAEVPP